MKWNHANDCAEREDRDTCLSPTERSPASGRIRGLDDSPRIIGSTRGSIRRSVARNRLLETSSEAKERGLHAADHHRRLLVLTKLLLLGRRDSDRVKVSSRDALANSPRTF